MITIDLELLDEHQVSPDEYFYIYSRAHNFHELYPHGFSFELAVDEEHLLKKGFIELIENHPAGQTHYKVTKKGAKLVGANRRQYTILIEKEMANVENWVEEYRQLWPAVSTNGRLIRAAKPNCVKKLKSFIKKHSSKDLVMTKDVIINATKKYLAGQARERYMYTKQCDHFIWKDMESNSVLRTWVDICEEDPQGVNNTSNDMTDDI